MNNLRPETLLYLLIFLSLAVAVFVNASFWKDLRERRYQKAQLREQRAQILGHRPGRIERYVSNERNLISATKTDWKSYVLILTASVVFGFMFGKLIFSDTALSFFVTGFCVVIPHIYLVNKQNTARRILAENLESAMRMVTHEYISTLDIEKAVENSVATMPHDKPFREFLVDCKLISNNVERNLRRLESKEHNVFFSRWVDQLIMAQSDRSQIVNLMPIIDDMNDTKTAQYAAETKIASAWREYFTLLFIVLVSPLLVRFVQYEWYLYLVTTPIGKLLVILLLASLAFSTFRAIKINKSIL